MKQSLIRIPWGGIILLVLCILCAHSSATSNDDYVKVEAKVSPKQVKADGQGELVIQFKPQSGIHINLEPPIQLTLDENQNIALLPTQHKPSKTQEGYLSTKKPLRYKFRVTSGTPPGDIVITGKLKYFYCSDDEGWCRMATEEVRVTVKIVRW